jgi:hypothetical protein
MVAPQNARQERPPVPSPARLTSLSTLIVLAVALGACGRRGDPTPPPGTTMEKVELPDGKTVERRKKPTRPFVLDGLLN